MASSIPSSPNLGLGTPSTFAHLDGQKITPKEALETYKQYRNPDKVMIRFKATGNAPILKQTVFKVSASSQFQVVIGFLRRQLGFKPSDPLFLYINASFAPAPDDLVSNLFASFGTETHLIVNYSSTQAWG
ncbi:hypothetical protein JCM5353_007266 [Sporobolomyces roseus]